MYYFIDLTIKENLETVIANLNVLSQETEEEQPEIQHLPQYQIKPSDYITYKYAYVGQGSLP